MRLVLLLHSIFGGRWFGKVVGLGTLAVVGLAVLVYALAK